MAIKAHNAIGARHYSRLILSCLKRNLYIGNQHLARPYGGIFIAESLKRRRFFPQGIIGTSYNFGVEFEIEKLRFSKFIFCAFLFHFLDRYFHRYFSRVSFFFKTLFQYSRCRIFYFSFNQPEHFFVAVASVFGIGRNHSSGVIQNPGRLKSLF